MAPAGGRRAHAGDLCRLRGGDARDLCAGGILRGGGELNASEQGTPSEEELRAQLEEELKRIKVDDVLLQTVVTLVNLAGQRLGLSEAGKDVRDLDQSRTAIEAVRALLPILEAAEGGAQRVRPIRDALAQLQMAYAREAGAEKQTAGGEGPAEPAGGEAPGARSGEGRREAPRRAEDAGGVQRPRPSGGLWVPPGSAR